MQLVLPTPAAFVLGGRNMHRPAQHIKTAPPPRFLLHWKEILEECGCTAWSGKTRGGIFSHSIKDPPLKNVQLKLQLCPTIVHRLANVGRCIHTVLGWSDSLYIVPTCCRTPVPKFQVSMLLLTCLMTVTLKSAKYCFTFFKPVTYSLIFLKLKMKRNLNCFISYV